jgi:hypothetical protein
MTARVTFEDAALQRVNEYLAKLKKLKLRVGYQDAEGKMRHPMAPHLAVAHLAAIHEFGSDKVPGQSFIRGTVQQKGGQISAAEEREFSAGLTRVVNGGDPHAESVRAFSAIGSLAVRLIRETLAGARRHDGGRALDETGTLARNLTWRVSAGRETFARGSH